MKRICLLGAVVAGVLILGVASALAASSHNGKKAKTPTTVMTKVSCTSSLTLQAPAGATDVTPSSESGTQAGPISCPGVGKGVEWETYTTDDSGDIVGKWQAWYNTGSVYGTVTLTPDDNSPPTTTSTFSQASYTGTFIVKNGTGTFAKAAGTGTIKCSTQDAVHFSCKESGKVSLPLLTGKKK